MAPLSDPLTIRLPADLIAWLDARVGLGLYANRSEAIRELLEAVAEAAPEEPSAEAAARTEVERLKNLMALPWSIIPLRPFHTTHKAISRLGFGEMFEMAVDPFFTPETYIPFGIWTDDARAERYMIEEFRIGGGADLLGGRATSLVLAGETSWRNGLPSKVTVDPLYFEPPICKAPNISVVKLRVAAPQPALVSQEQPPTHAFRRRLMTWAPSEPVTFKHGDAKGLERAKAVEQSAQGAVEMLTISELFSSIGLDVAGLRQALADLLQPIPEPLRIGILCTTVMDRDRLNARLRMGPETGRY